MGDLQIIEKLQLIHDIKNTDPSTKRAEFIESYKKLLSYLKTNIHIIVTIDVSDTSSDLTKTVHVSINKRKEIEIVRLIKDQITSYIMNSMSESDYTSYKHEWEVHSSHMYLELLSQTKGYKCDVEYALTVTTGSPKYYKYGNFKKLVNVLKIIKANVKKIHLGGDHLPYNKAASFIVNAIAHFGYTVDVLPQRIVNCIKGDSILLNKVMSNEEIKPMFALLLL